MEWMLPFYYSITGYFFDAQRDLPLLQAFFTEADTTLWQRVEHSAADFRGLGQMGDYWLSVLRLA
jgi:predicted secreted protein